MFDREWFRLQKDREFADNDLLETLSGRKYPYFMDEKAFKSIDDSTETYKFSGHREFNDMLFIPTFMISDRLQSLFRYLEPDMEFKSLHFINDRMKEDLPSPLYWIPYLPYEDVIHGDSDIVQGKAKKLILKKEAAVGRRILHTKLPAEDIWLMSLEAAECLLRRSPQGISMKKVTVRE